MGKAATAAFVMLMVGICSSTPISTTLNPAGASPTSVTIQKSIETHSIEPKLDRTGWEPIVMHLLPQDSYFPQSKTVKVTQPPPTSTPEVSTTTTTEAAPSPSIDPTAEENVSDSQNDVEADGDVSASLQSNAYAAAGTSWTPISPFYEARNGQLAQSPAYYPAPALFGQSVNNYKPPALTYTAVSGPSTLYGAPEQKEEIIEQQAPGHYSADYPSPVKAAVGLKYANLAPIRSVQYESIPSKEYGQPEAPQIHYGAPVSKVPGPEYGPPQAEYGPPQAEYGVPKAAPVAEYGPPQAEYGVPKAAPVAEYGPPQAEYGVPKAAPVSEYGPPQAEYGPPKSEAPEIVEKEVVEYGPPPKSAYGGSQAVEKEESASTYGAPGPAYGYPVYGAPHTYTKEVVPVVKKVHVKHENLVHRHNHHKHILHEHHLHKLHVHNHHLHRFHVHNHHLHKQHVHVPITHNHEKSVVKVTAEHKTIPTVGNSHKHVHTQTESVKTLPPIIHGHPQAYANMHVVNPHSAPAWTVWG